MRGGGRETGRKVDGETEASFITELVPWRHQFVKPSASPTPEQDPVSVAWRATPGDSAVPLGAVQTARCALGNLPDPLLDCVLPGGPLFPQPF